MMCSATHHHNAPLASYAAVWTLRSDLIESSCRLYLSSASCRTGRLQASPTWNTSLWLPQRCDKSAIQLNVCIHPSIHRCWSDLLRLSSLVSTGREAEQCPQVHGEGGGSVQAADLEGWEGARREKSDAITARHGAEQCNAPHTASIVSSCFARAFCASLPQPPLRSTLPLSLRPAQDRKERIQQEASLNITASSYCVLPPFSAHLSHFPLFFSPPSFLTPPCQSSLDAVSVPSSSFLRLSSSLLLFCSF
jgi:hypothetical protein